jgi:diguanylate cyclase (GGDEF)-like protein
MLFLSLDYSTVHFCSSLLNVSYATMLLILWVRRRETPLLYWSLSLYLVAGAGYGFTLTDGTLATALLYGLIAANVTLIWAGARAFDGKPAFEWRMAVPPTLVALVYWIASSAGRPDLADAIATLLLGFNVFLAGRYFLLRGGKTLRFGRKIVAGALFAYIPIYIVSASLALFGLQDGVSAIAILVGDLVLNNVFVAGLYSVIEDRTRNALRLMAETDELTGALNRGGFLKEGVRLTKPDDTAAMLLVDLDHFKQINDAFGHAAGDAVLQTFVERTRDALGETAIVGRLGGEEFAILLPRCGDRAALEHAETVRLSMAGRPVMWGDIAIKATVSIGVAGRRRNEALELTLRRSDEALYRAKNNGRNQIAA